MRQIHVVQIYVNIYVAHCVIFFYKSLEFSIKYIREYHGIHIDLLVHDLHVSVPYLAGNYE